jgi:hypothetical protein
MRMGGIVLGILVTLAGGVWVLQGLGVAFAPRSFMTADPTWAWIGAITAVAGLGLVAWSIRRGT